MAGGRLTAVTGQTITAANHNTYIRDQTINQYASEAARDSADLTPATGSYCVTTDTGYKWRYSGSKWLRQPVTVCTAADVGYITTTALANDATLQMPVAANSKYYFDFNILWLASTAIGYKQAFSFPASTRVDCTRLTRDSTATIIWDQQVNLTTSATSLGFFGSTASFNWGSCRCTGVVETGATAGTFAWMAAQNVSSGTGAYTLRNSTLFHYQIS